jgi:hypothetical protein
MRLASVNALRARFAEAHSINQLSERARLWTLPTYDADEYSGRLSTSLAPDFARLSTRSGPIMLSWPGAQSMATSIFGLRSFMSRTATRNLLEQLWALPGLHKARGEGLAW